MTYTIDDSSEDRVRVLFIDPYAFEVDLRYLKVHDTDPQEYQMAISTHFKPEDSSAMVDFVRGLTPSKLAEFFSDVAEYMLTRAAQINAGG